ncbi:cytochrome P450 [Planobispora rosea]|uniref:Cytochrome P450 n=1 Tax=Planobispora rosea TaxID=35762 RepID=A0A8J3RVA2_PLARO|nr:cytochrome P450 [Planobispora rosea]GGS75242.1 cytochrome P450 [Planobispora rosea]GIH81833.1 cytochrome P450 [Planobispora rosea]
MTATTRDHTLLELIGMLIDPAARPDPYPLYSRIRELGPSVLDLALWENPGIVISSYRECEAVLRDPRMSSQRGRDRNLADLMPSGAPSSVRQRWFLSLDPPDHTRLRRLVSAAFTARRIGRLSERISELVDELLDRAAERDAPFDIVEDLAYPLPMTVICEMLGVPAADHEQVRDWSSRLTRLIDGFGAPPTGESVSGLLALNVYLNELIASRQADPGDDLVSALIAVREGGDSLSHDELVSIVALLLVAGHETTVNLIANGALALLRHPDHFAALRENPQLADAVVEETLRYDPPVHITARVATEDMELSGVRLRRGAMVVLLLAAAHRDPGETDNPDAFDPYRPEIKHLAFGLGPHYCLGAPLARLEARLALTRLVQRLPEPALLQDPPPYRDHVNLRGPLSITVPRPSLRA